MYMLLYIQSQNSVILLLQKMQNVFKMFKYLRSCCSESREDTKHQCNKVPIYHKNSLRCDSSQYEFLYWKKYTSVLNFFLNKKWIGEATTVLHCSHGAKSLHSETAPVNLSVIQIHKYKLCFGVLPLTLDRP